MRHESGSLRSFPTTDLQPSSWHLPYPAIHHKMALFIYIYKFYLQHVVTNATVTAVPCVTQLTSLADALSISSYPNWVPPPPNGLIQPSGPHSNPSILEVTCTMWLI